MKTSRQAVVLFLMLCPFISAQADCSLTVKAVSKKVSKDEPLRFSVAIGNTGTEDLLIYKDLSYGIRLTLHDASGQIIQPKVNYEHAPPPPQASDFITLSGHHSLVFYDRYTAHELGLPAGKYKAAVSFEFIRANGQLSKPACNGLHQGGELISFQVVQ